MLLEFVLLLPPMAVHIRVCVCVCVCVCVVLHSLACVYVWLCVSFCEYARARHVQASTGAQTVRSYRPHLKINTQP